MAANPFDAIDVAPAPAKTADASTARHSGFNLLDDYHDRLSRAADALWQDLSKPSTVTESVESAISPLTGRGAKIAGDLAEGAFAPISAAADYLAGRPLATGSEMLRQATHGATPTITPQQGGDIAQMGAALADPMLAEAKIAKMAREAGVSVEALKANLAERARLPSRGSPLERQTNPKWRAADRIVRSGGLDTKEAGAKAGALMGEHADTGVPNKPALLDVMGKTGQRLARTTGVISEQAEDLLTEHRASTRAGAPEEFVQRTEQESPYTVSVDKKIEALQKERDNRAATQYRAPYDHPIQSDDRLFEVLDSPRTMSAINQAMSSAKEHALDDPSSARQFHELKALRGYFDKLDMYERDHAEWEREHKHTPAANLPMGIRRTLENPNTPEADKAHIREQFGLGKESVEPQPPEKPVVSGGSLDRLRRILRDKANVQSRHGNRDSASYLSKHARAIDEYLQTVPHLAEARADYADYSKRIEQLEFDKNLATMRPNAFVEHIAELNPEQLKALTHNVFEREAAKFGTSARVAQSAEDIKTTGKNFRENLQALFKAQYGEQVGEDRANAYLRAVDLIGQKVDKANYISTGSRTAPLEHDIAKTGLNAMLNVLMGRSHTALHSIASHLTKGFLGMGQEEARQIAEWIVQQKDIPATLQEIDDVLNANYGKGKAASSAPAYIRALVAGAAARNAGRDGGGAVGTPPAASQPPAGSQSKDSANPFDKIDPPDQEVVSPADPAEDTSHLDKNISGLLDTVKGVEASGDDAVSPAGAIGRYQIWPPTARRYGFDMNRLTDPDYSKYAASVILKDLWDEFGGDKEAILIAYNGGPGRANEFLQSGRDYDVLKPETRGYLRKAGYDVPAEAGGGAADSGDLYSALSAEYAPQ